MDTLYNQSSDALSTLGDVWDKILAVVQSVSEAASESLRSEPNLVQLQKDRRELDALFDTLKKQVAWIQENKSALNTIQDTPDNEIEQELKEQKELRETSDRLSDQIKRLLSQSYALQFQTDMLLASSHDHSLKDI
ncbi:hypothetical protein O0I10_001386 [Lichtheimia ornata]|uniref:Uncharacterized protein n=1 Tax=Lichtheimia ornata TaxID=688661 RepID=A0AAD8DHB2_9FUNG|nr:uncharacterized protein O0I10_001386 [Lichtheimia ornata]KAJ8663209.1 hypothetical protein O0I10_001386 [Lichtheimia ornata]